MLSNASTWALVAAIMSSRSSPDAGVDQRLEKLACDGFGRTLFAGKRKKRVGARRLQRGEKPCHRQDEVVIAREVGRLERS
jgi:hypothetical protein